MSRGHHVSVPLYGRGLVHVQGDLWDEQREVSQTDGRREVSQTDGRREVSQTDGRRGFCFDLQHCAVTPPLVPLDCYKKHHGLPLLWHRG